MEGQNNDQKDEKDKSEKSPTLQATDNDVPEKDEKIEHIENESSSDESDLDLDLELKCNVCDKTFSGIKPLLQHEKSSKHHKMLQQKKMHKKVNRELENELSAEVGNILPEIFAECDTCKKQFFGPESFHQHLKSKGHQKKLATAKFLEQVTTENGKIDVDKLKDISKPKAGAAAYSPTLEETENNEQNISESHQFECKECDKIFSGVNNYYQHLVSKVHEKAMKQKGLLEKLSLGGFSRSTPQTEAASSDFSNDMDVIDVDGDVLTCRLCHKSFSGPESAADHLKSRGHAKKKELKEWKLKHKMAAVETKKTKALDERNGSEKSDSTTTSGLESSSKSSEVKESEEPGSAVLSQTEEITQGTEGGTSDAKVEGDEDSTKKNTLLCYESYKKYKEIMNEIEAKKQMM